MEPQLAALTPPRGCAGRLVSAALAREGRAGWTYLGALRALLTRREVMSTIWIMRS